MNEANGGRPASFGKKMRKVLFISMAVLFIGFILWMWIVLSYVYSSGERAGYVQKLSNKGWIFKTWEGELAMVSLPGTPAEIFAFTVRDDDVARKIQRLLGKRVALSYEEHVGIPWSVFGETRYFVIDIRLAE